MIIEVRNDIQIEFIEQIAIEIWNEYFTPIIGKNQVDYMLEKFQSKKAISKQIKQGYSYFLIKNNDEFIGYFGVFSKETKLCLSKLYIKASYRHKAYGKKALKFIQELASTKGLVKIILTVNKNNHQTILAYEKMGFKNLGSKIKDIGSGFIMDDYKMEKILR